MAKQNTVKETKEIDLKGTGATQGPVAVAEVKPSLAMLALFSQPTKTDVTKLQRVNMPQMIKPDAVPVGSCISGEIVDIVNSPVSTVKGKLLWLKHESGQEITFPCTGVIRSALAPGLKSEDKELMPELRKHIGKLFVATRLANKVNSTYKKEQFMFDAFLSVK